MRPARPFLLACVASAIAPADAVAQGDALSASIADWPTAAAWAVASDQAAGEGDRVAALGLFGIVPGQADPERSLLAELLRPGVGPRLQVAAIAAIARGGSAKASQTLLIAWNGYGPEARSAALDALLSLDDWAGALLSSLEDTCVPPSDVGPRHRKALRDHPNGEFRARARVVFDGGDDPQ